VTINAATGSGNGAVLVNASPGVSTGVRFDLGSAVTAATPDTPAEPNPPGALEMMRSLQIPTNVLEPVTVANQQQREGNSAIHADSSHTLPAALGIAADRSVLVPVADQDNPTTTPVADDDPEAVSGIAVPTIPPESPSEGWSVVLKRTKSVTFLVISGASLVWGIAKASRGNRRRDDRSRALALPRPNH
jgi:hypothetical protein